MMIADSPPLPNAAVGIGKVALRLSIVGHVMPRAAICFSGEICCDSRHSGLSGQPDEHRLAPIVDAGRARL